MLGTILLGILAFFIPPFPVVVRRGCGADLLINIVLTFLCWIPGVLHAWYILIRYSGKPQRRVERGYSPRASGSYDRPQFHQGGYHGGYARPPPPKMGSY